jgi:hypothetical protein
VQHSGREHRTEDYRLTVHSRQFPTLFCFVTLMLNFFRDSFKGTLGKRDIMVSWLKCLINAKTRHL